jgi:predicted lipoprotein with Yx(FWY)xxD motif
MHNRAAPVVALVAVVLLAACRAGASATPSAAVPTASPSAAASAESSASAAASAAASEAAGPPTVTTADVDDLGTVLVGGEGWVLYLFTNDPEGESACTGDCAANWPPLTVPDEASLTAGEDVAAELGVIERDDGSLQVTAAGHPLYRYAADPGPGVASGHEVGGVWFAVTADGEQAQAGMGGAGDPYPN